MRVLVVVNGWPPADLGGAAVYAEQHARMLARLHGDDVTVLTREADDARPEYSVRESDRDGLHVVTVNNTFRAVRRFAESYAPAAVERVARALIATFRPEVAHVHHLTGLSTSIVPALAAARVPTVFTVHDYWLLCHRGQLLDLELSRCSGPTPAGCARCLGAAAAAPALVSAAAPALRQAARLLPATARLLRGAITPLVSHAADERQAQSVAAARIAHMREVATLPAVLLAPSTHMRDRVLGFGVPADRVRVWPLGLDHAPFRTLGRSPGTSLRLGFLGSLMVSKGAHVLLDAFSRLPPGRATLTLLGEAVAYHGDTSYERTLSAFAALAGVAWHGRIPHEEVPARLAEIDVLVVPSIWEENSPLVIREAFLAGVPVVASRIGGIPEAVVHGVNGLLVPPGDARSLHEALARLLDDAALLPRLREGLPQVRPLEDDVEATRLLYRELAGAGARRAPDPRVAAVVLNYRTPDETVLAVRSIAASRRPPADIVVVDNASDGSCRAALGPLADEVLMLEQPQNVGFPAGVNAGVRAALDRGATHVLLVNSDVILPPETLGLLLEALAAHPAAGIVGPVVLSRARPGEIASAGMAWAARTGRMRHPHAGRPYDEAALPQWIDVDGVSGCVMLVDAAVFARGGLFPEEYFFSFEDLAFCLQARGAGIASGIAGRAVAYHEGGRTMGAGTPRRLYYAARNHLRLAAVIRDGGRIATAGQTASIVALNLAHAVRAPGANVAVRLAAVSRGIRDHLRGRYGPDPAR